MPSSFFKSLWVWWVSLALSFGNISEIWIWYIIGKPCLTHWGRVTHICIGNLTIIVSDNGLSPGRRQAIIGNNDGILPIGLLGTNFSEILIEILTFSFKKIRLKVSSPKWRPFCLGFNVLRLVKNRDNNGIGKISLATPSLEQRERHFTESTFESIHLIVTFCSFIKSLQRLLPDGPVVNSDPFY